VDMVLTRSIFETNISLILLDIAQYCLILLDTQYKWITHLVKNQRTLFFCELEQLGIYHGELDGALHVLFLLVFLRHALMRCRSE
jgi:hypothetical protein